MSSPPPSATSPTSSNGFSLPRKRPGAPGLQIPSQNKRARKPSTTSINSHPLRQTSFPPPESSPHDADGSSPARQGSFSPSVNSFSGIGKGRGKKKRPGAARSATAASTARDGDERSVGRAGSQAAGANGQEEEDPEEDEDEGLGAEDALLEDGELMSDATRKQDQRYKVMLMDNFSPEQMTRYEIYNRVKLRTANVKRLINMTVNQSVTAPVVTTVTAFSKVFIGDLVEMARDVQAEWLVAERMAQESKHPGVAKQKQRLSQTNGTVNGVNGTSAGSLGNGTSSHGSQLANGASASNTQDMTQNTSSTEVTQDDGHQPEHEVTNMIDIDEKDRGPLTPDHLREALRRYKKNREGGSAGFQGESMLGREMTASRVGGRRLFR